jgi:hypothetical protein
MRNQLEERVEALENVIMDLLSLVSVPQGNESMEAVERALAHIRIAGRDLQTAGIALGAAYVATSPMKAADFEAVGRITAYTNRVLDTRNGVEG